MPARPSLQPTLEDLSAMLLAADPSDPKVIGHLATQLESILATNEAPIAGTEFLSLAVRGLRNAEAQERADILCILATAISAISQHSAGQDQQSSAALETATAALRELLVTDDKPCHAA